MANHLKTITANPPSNDLLFMVVDYISMKMHGSACVLQTMAIDKYTLLNVFSYRGRSVSFNSLTKNKVKEARVPTTYYFMGLWEKEEWD